MRFLCGGGYWEWTRRIRGDGEDMRMGMIGVVVMVLWYTATGVVVILDIQSSSGLVGGSRELAGRVE